MAGRGGRTWRWRTSKPSRPASRTWRPTFLSSEDPGSPPPWRGTPSPRTPAPRTPPALPDDETLRGAPKGWVMEVRGVRPSAGAGFLVVLAGDIMRMPGLGPEPAALQMDIDETGKIKGLF